MLSENIDQIIKECSNQVIVAATKYVAASDLLLLREKGIKDFGENRVDDFLIKYQEMKEYEERFEEALRQNEDTIGDVFNEEEIEAFVKRVEKEIDNPEFEEYYDCIWNRTRCDTFYESYVHFLYLLDDLDFSDLFFAVVLVCKSK